MIPYDATSHIQGFAQGIKDAMPGIQTAIDRGKPGDENIQRYLNMYAERAAKGEPKASILADLVPSFQKDMLAQQNQPTAPNAMGDRKSVV
jgi:hypothetical protein